METGFACLLVCVGLFKLIRTRFAPEVGLSALFFILAALTHPDHAIFYGVGSAVWSIYHYDRALMTQLRKIVPDARFKDFENHLDGYIHKAKKKRPQNSSAMRSSFATTISTTMTIPQGFVP